MMGQAIKGIRGIRGTKEGDMGKGSLPRTTQALMLAIKQDSIKEWQII